ncbi:LuxR C-terminal-related transcriptional regulator [Saccharopolyspora sp. 5N102]|uniref:response regulator transcription factor n=1 Tax=Saccharopolyspora sp. 5N102 TaxID=3375155 RepID=UPI0037A93BA4
MTKHARATRAAAAIDRVGDELRIEIGDDGIGGIDESKGTGVAGIRHRVAALDGRPVLVFSQYVEETYARELLSDGRGAVGYLLKDRVSRVDEFVDALRRIADGGTVMDQEVVAQLLTRRHDPLAALTPREREVLALMAAGYANAEIAARLFVTERAVLKHVGNIFAKLDLPVGDSGHRRVLAVLAYLGG